MPIPALHASVHGFSPTATGLANRAALQAAVTAAIAADVDLYLGAGSFTIEMDAVNVSILVPTALRIFGRGSGKTILTFTPATPSFNTFGFDCTGTSGTYMFEGMTWHGPTTEVSPYSTVSSGIRWQVSAAVGLIYCKDLVVDGVGWDAAWNTSNKADMLVEDCELSAREKGFSMFESTNTVSTRCVMRNVYIHDCVSTGSIGIYIHPHIQLDVDSNCRFENVARWGIYQNGSPTTFNPHTIIRGYYKDCGIAQTTSDGHVLITDFVNEGKGFNVGSSILIREDATITNGEFIGAINSIQALQSTDHRVIIEHVRGSDLTGSFALCQGNDTRWRLTDIILHFAGSGNGISVPTSTQAPDVEIDGVTLTGATTGDGIGANVTLAKVRVKNVKSLLSDGRSIVVSGTAGVGSYDLEGFDYQGTASTDVTINLSGTSAGKITGRNNNLGTAATGFALGSTNQQKMTRRVGIAPTAVASTASMNLSSAAELLSFNTFLVTGSTTINTISGNLAFEGPIYLVAAAGSAWSLGSSGNIVANSVTRAVNSVVALLWEPTAAKWLEIESKV